MVIAKKSPATLLIIYFIIICILFFLPGKALPKGSTWMEIIQFDKWVHFGIFGVLAYLCCFAIEIKSSKTLIQVFLALVIYGLAVEVVQHFFIANRSFDVGDLAADSAGAFTGLWGWKHIKK